MAHPGDPFDDILQPKPLSDRQPTFEDDPFGDDDPFNNPPSSQSAGPSHNQVRGPNAREGTQQHGFALDPFFDE